MNGDAAPCASPFRMRPLASLAALAASPAVVASAAMTLGAVAIALGGACAASTISNAPPPPSTDASALVANTPVNLCLTSGPLGAKCKTGGVCGEGEVNDTDFLCLSSIELCCVPAVALQIDASQPLPDGSFVLPHDAGVDAAGPPRDSGGPPRDSGGPPRDSGGLPGDSGGDAAHPHDAGQPHDAGEPRDTGSDTAKPPGDAGMARDAAKG